MLFMEFFLLFFLSLCQGNELRGDCRYQALYESQKPQLKTEVILGFCFVFVNPKTKFLRNLIWDDTSMGTESKF